MGYYRSRSATVTGPATGTVPKERIGREPAGENGVDRSVLHRKDWYWRSTQDTDRDHYSLKDQRPKIKVSNDLIWLSELVSRLVVYTTIILSNP